MRFLRRWIEDIAYELDASGTEYVFLKGSILSHTQFAGKPVYASGERVSNDVDLLIRPKDAGRVSRALARIGFRQGSWDEKRGAFRPLSRLEIVARRMNRGETAPLIASTGNARFPFVEVDVNFSVDYLPFGQERLVEGMLLSRWTKRAGSRALRPSGSFSTCSCISTRRACSTLRRNGEKRPISINFWISTAY